MIGGAQASTVGNDDFRGNKTAISADLFVECYRNEPE